MMGCVYFIVEPIILDIFPNCGGSLSCKGHTLGTSLNPLVPRPLLPKIGLQTMGGR